jgi:shikimate kinase
LGRPFADLDATIERETQRSIAELFADSETNFREIEEQALRTLVVSGPPNLVIATGGGVILRTASRSLLASTLCVFLEAGAAELRRRLAADPAPRPPLLGKDSLDEIDEVVAARDPLYRIVADLTVSTEGRTPEEAAADTAARVASASETEKRNLERRSGL